MTKLVTSILFFILISIPAAGEFKNLPKVIQEADNSTVLIKINKGDKYIPMGSGVVVVRGDDYYVWTDAHVVDEAKKDGVFDKMKVQKKLFKEDVEVSSLEVFAEVIAYNEQIDIALLKLSSGSPKHFKNTKWYLDDKVLPRGTDILFCGNFLSFRGSNPGQTGTARATIGGYGHVLDDQKFDISHDGAAIGGCSGSGVFIQDGRCIGLVCRIYSTNSVLYSPIREIKKWAAKENLMWALDENVKKAP